MTRRLQLEKREVISPSQVFLNHQDVSLSHIILLAYNHLDESAICGLSAEPEKRRDIDRCNIVISYYTLFLRPDFSHAGNLG